MVTTSKVIWFQYMFHHCGRYVDDSDSVTRDSQCNVSGMEYLKGPIANYVFVIVMLCQWHGVPQGSYSQNMSLVLNLVSDVSILLRVRHIGWPFSGGTAIDLDNRIRRRLSRQLVLVVVLSCFLARPSRVHLWRVLGVRSGRGCLGSSQVTGPWYLGQRFQPELGS